VIDRYGNPPPGYVHRPPLHFVGFKDDRVWAALKVFGPPDFWHRIWDVRARLEIVPGDIAVFASGTIDDPVRPFTHDDSSVDVHIFEREERCARSLPHRDGDVL